LRSGETTAAVGDAWNLEVAGWEQAANPAPCTLHSTVADAGRPLKSKVALR
jgi:hypothetical protein